MYAAFAFRTTCIKAHDDMLRPRAASRTGTGPSWEKGAACIAHRQVIHEGIRVHKAAHRTRRRLSCSGDDGAESIASTKLDVRAVGIGNEHHPFLASCLPQPGNDLGSSGKGQHDLGRSDGR